MHQQRRAQRVGELDAHRKELLDQEGMAWEAKLAALRSFRRAHGHLAPRQDAVWGEAEDDLVAIGQLMANLRRTDGLGKDPERATARGEQLAAIDQDWNCPWPLDWQRHYRILADLADTEAGGPLPDIQAGVLFEGDDLGKWLAQQRRAHTWAQLSGEQQERLDRLGVTLDEPAPAPVTARTAKGAGGLSAPFRRGVAALAQYLQREGRERPVPRKHEEPVDIDGREHVVKLGVFVSNTKSRRDRLTPEQRQVLAELGVEWA
ncbi:hypothetical protein A6A29_40100 [Streptomyces sp. TSRI0281]|nr:hypothetical protein A6A29_40100 [Streptomyces sp. TSRI0281]